MREVKISLIGWNSPTPWASYEQWLDHHNCVPVSFDIERGQRGVLVIRIVFAEDVMADAFERDFGGRSIR